MKPRLAHARYDFAGGVAWKFIAEVHVAGNRVIGKVVADEVADGFIGKRLASLIPITYYPHGDAGEGVFVFNALGVNILDAGHFFQDFNDRLWVNVFATDDYHVVGAANHVQVVIFIDKSKVTDGY